MSTWLAPNGREIVATLEKLIGTCDISDISDDGTPEHDGTGTEVDWDSQETATRDGKVIYLDDGGDEWTFDQLTKQDEDDEDDEA